MSETDLQLLRRFAGTGCDEAFGDLVRRHVNLVFSAARRRLPNAALAEEVTQTVFLELAQQARRLNPDTVVSAWLYQAALNRAVDVVRRETRRQVREQIAVEIQSMNTTTTEDWSRIEPVLDEAMQTLAVADRTAVILRYFENRSLREVGERLGVSDDAAQKRVQRAVDRLREVLVARGIPVGSISLAAMVAEFAVQAAPDTLATGITRAASRAGMLRRPAGAARRGLLTTLGLQQLVRHPIALSAAVVTLTGLVGLRILATSNRTDATSSGAAGSGRGVQSLGAEGAADTGSSSATTQVATLQKPDALELLQRVAHARQRIEFGSSDWEVSVELLQNGRRETNHWRVTSVFDHDKWHVDETGTEYAYAFSKTDQESIQRRADAMSRADAVRAGLLEAFESRYVIASDGTVLLEHWIAGNQRPRTVIREPGKGATGMVIHPWWLGLGTFMSPGTTVGACLGFGNAKSVECLGSELIRGNQAWHVRVTLKSEDALNFWIDSGTPERVIQMSAGTTTVVSEFDEANRRDPIPIRVTVLGQRRNTLVPEKRYQRTRLETGTPPPPSTFELSGLGMAEGTEVVDERIMRRIGYWTGSGLSENPPRSTQPAEKETVSTPVLDLASRVKLLESSPATPEALESAKWILSNTPDGAQTDLAISVILHDHTRASGLGAMCQELLRVRPQRGMELLTAILRENPEPESRAAACMALASWFKDKARYGEDQPALASAIQHFERVLAEFPDFRDTAGYRLRERAAPQLHELLHLTLGHAAPPIDGIDLEERPLSLAQFKGRVVVLRFWTPNDSEVEQHREFAERLSSESVEVVGVCVAQNIERARALVRKHQLTTPLFMDTEDGPISKSYHVESWPNVWVLDRNATIRFRGWGGSGVDQKVKELLRSGE